LLVSENPYKSPEANEEHVGERKKRKGLPDWVKKPVVVPGWILVLVLLLILLLLTL